MQESGRALAHWPEYLAAAAGLGLSMISACLFGTWLGHPDSPVVRAIPDPLVRRVLMGLAMGLTAVGLICSPWGATVGRPFANTAGLARFTPLGMLLAAQLYVCRHGLAAVLCPKLHHDNRKRCIFRCRHPELAARQSRVAAAEPSPA